MSDQQKLMKSMESTKGESVPESNQGRWSAEEHRLFIEAVNQFGREWDKVQSVVKTRSLAQVRSHAQKYFLKLSRSEDLERLHENELWTLAAQPQGSSGLNALVVLDIMTSVLKRMKTKRDEICGSMGNEQTSLGSNSSANSLSVRDHNYTSQTNTPQREDEGYSHKHHKYDNGDISRHNDTYDSYGEDRYSMLLQAAKDEGGVTETEGFN
ncbi:hypothetical protein EON65_52930 [archaeon]|nr:MAG: hypothetical protein EON65_52930 [archaeon]